MSKYKNTRHKQKVVIISLIIVLLLIISFTTITHAQALYSNTVTATIPPHYVVTPKGDILFIETNMKTIVNGKEVTN